MSKKALMNNVYKNYIFDFYGTLVDILTDEKDPALWDKLAQLYQAYGADYKGEGLRKSYAKRVALAREELIELKGVAYPAMEQLSCGHLVPQHNPYFPSNLQEVARYLSSHRKEHYQA